MINNTAARGVLARAGMKITATCPLKPADRSTLPARVSLPVERFCGHATEQLPLLAHLVEIPVAQRVAEVVSELRDMPKRLQIELFEHSNIGGVINLDCGAIRRDSP